MVNWIYIILLQLKIFFFLKIWLFILSFQNWWWHINLEYANPNAKIQNIGINLKIIPTIICKQFKKSIVGVNSIYKQNALEEKTRERERERERALIV